MRLYAFDVELKGSDVPSGSSPVYQRRSAGLSLIRLTSSVTEAEFW